MDLEINPLKPELSFKSMKTYDHGENTIYEFENVGHSVLLNKNMVRKFKGTYLPIVPAPHYFHFLKEYLGSFLYYKKHIDSNAKVLWLDSVWEGDKHHDTQEPIKKTLEILTENNISIVFLKHNDILKSEIEFEKIAIIYDTSTFLVSTEFPHFDQFNHTNNEEVRSFFSHLMKKDENYPKKVYVSRKNVSEILEKENKKNHISRYNPPHVEKALEDFFTQKGYETIDFSGMPLEKQIMYMYNATHVAGLMGAGTWNAIFCDNNVNIFCLKTHFWFHHEYEKDIHKVIDANYKIIEIINQKSYDSVLNELIEKISEA
jgi:Glycosyltransferase 61